MAFHPQYPKNPRFYVQYTDRGGDTRVVEYRARDGTCAAGQRAPALLQRRPLRQPQRRAAGVRPERPALLHDRRRRRGRRSGEPLPEHALALRQAALAERRDEGAPDRGARPPQRVAVHVRPRHRRPLHRRRRPERARGDQLPAAREPGPRELRLGRLRGRASGSRTSRSGPGKLVFPVAEYTHADGCSVTGGYVYRGSSAALRGRYIYGDYCSGNIWSFKIESGKARGLRREAFKVEGLTSFGEDAAGELYAVSHGGTIYRLTP